MKATLLTASITALFSLTACERRDSAPSHPSSSAPNETTAPTPSANVLRLRFAYGSEKEKWITELTRSFNESHIKIADGRTIFVDPLPMGSGDAMRLAQDPAQDLHLLSPASAAFITLANAQARARTGADLVPATHNLVLSPVVIAIWEPMAKALGWPGKPLGWKDIYQMARRPDGWAGAGFPQWGAFRFGHTHPEYSNSGLISVIAELYAATGKRTALTLEDLQQPHTGEFLHAIESSVVHYGESTGFFGRKMFQGGPSYLSAAVLYENMVIEAASDPALPLPVVAIYPVEGTFWSDHPAGIIDLPHVSPAHRQAAEIYLDHLLAPPQQRRALAYGFRPADPAIPLESPFDTTHGVDPKQPQTTLDVPPAPVIDAALQLWKQHKKKSHIVLVIDCSGSMKEEEKMPNARQGALEMLKLLGGEDSITLIPFNETVQRTFEDQPLATAHNRIQDAISGLFPNGGTALYDAIANAHDLLHAKADKQRINAIIVLTDGADTNSTTLNLDALLKKIAFNEENAATRIFTIGYGSGARTDILKNIAESTRAKYFQGTPKNIRQVFREISTFF